jgi:DtxR family Mn-dependent transcriptional regulator
MGSVPPHHLRCDGVAIQAQLHARDGRVRRDHRRTVHVDPIRVQGPRRAVHGVWYAEAKGAARPMPHSVEEDYLAAIYNMQMEGEPVIGARLAALFKVKAPTVTQTIHRLEKQRLVVVDEHKRLDLTPAGRAMAEALLRRHRLSERFLVDVMGMQWHEVHDEAARLEHVISPALEARMLAQLDHPTTCPHGNPIPGLVEAPDFLRRQRAYRLDAAAPGVPLVVVTISEVVEDERALITLLHGKGLTPGTALVVVGRGPDGGLGVLVNGSHLQVDANVAHMVWVRAVDA